MNLVSPFVEESYNPFTWWISCSICLLWSQIGWLLHPLFGTVGSPGHWLQPCTSRQQVEVFMIVSQPEVIPSGAAKWGCTTLRKWQSISQVPHQNHTLIDIPPLLDTPRNHMVGHSFRCPWSPLIISNYEPLLANIDHYQPSYVSMIQLSILEFQSGNCVNSHGNIIILTIAIHWGNHVMGYVGYYSPTTSVISELLVMTSTT